MIFHPNIRITRTPSIRRHLAFLANGTFLVGSSLWGGMDNAHAAQPRPTSTTSVHHASAPAVRHGNTPPATQPPAPQPEVLHVNSQRRAFKFASAQHVADSTTRLSAETLTERHIVDEKGLEKVAPNVTIQSVQGTASTNFFVRGVGIADYTQNNTSSVMTYIDGVAYPYSTMASGMMFDLDNVEVEPGPVGTTHGMSDSGGEVNIHTADPTEKFHGALSEDIASYNRSRTQGFISGPITDKLSFRIAGQTMHGGGYQSDPYHSGKLGSADTWALRAKLLYRPDDKTEIMLTGHWMLDDSRVIVGKPLVNFLANQSNTPGLGFYQAEWDLRPDFAKLVGRSPNMYPSEHNIMWGADLKMSRDLNFATIRSISAFETEREAEYTDQDGTAYATGDQYRNIVANSFSQELSLGTTHKSDRFQWVVGAYYNRTRMLQNFNFDFTDYALRGYLSTTAFNQDQQTFSQYVHLSYRFPHHVTLFGGLNHEADDRQLLGLSTIHYGVNDLQFKNEDTSANQFSGVIGVQWQALKNLLVYYKMSRGFKPGGFTGNNTVVQQQLTPFKPEWLLAYEAGFKADIIPNKFRLNGAAFYYDYHDQQIISSYLVPSYGPLGMFVNIPQSQIWGIEFTADIHPLKNLYITQNFGYERGKYTNFHALNSSATDAYYTAHQQWVGIYSNFSGVDDGIPKLTLNGNGEYRWHLQDYELDTGVDWMFRSAQAMVPGGLGSYRLPAYFLLGAHITFKPRKGWWTATLYATNLANRHYYESSGQATTTYFAIPGEPRFIGGRVGVKF